MFRIVFKTQRWYVVHVQKIVIFFFNWVLHIYQNSQNYDCCHSWTNPVICGQKKLISEPRFDRFVHQSPGELLTWSTHLSLFILCPRASSVPPLQLLFVFVYNISFHLLLDMAKGFNYTRAWLANDKASLWVTLTGLLLESHLWITHTDSARWTPQDVINIKSPREKNQCVNSATPWKGKSGQSFNKYALFV